MAKAEVSQPEPADLDARLSTARKVRRALRVGRDRPLALAEIDPRSTPELPDEGREAAGPKAWSRAEVSTLGGPLRTYQERLYANARVGGDRRRVLLVLQALDCGGKDGTVRNVLGAMDPLGVQITVFGAPTATELGHHFLWRIHPALPGRGYLAVFNRSHYEDVLAARVRGLVPEDVWRRRYDEINEFERAEHADGLTIIKVMLHISYDEQRTRLLARLDDPHKRWKFDPGDVADRALWHDYHAAYEEALTRCDTAWAPWYVVPADRKWYRNWAVTNIMLAHLAELELSYPEPSFDLAAQRRALLSAASGDRSGKHLVNNG
ncbi:MAG TPA: PPK2 family polyphosphate kinase [Micromonosporaceae bacterium]